MSAARFIVTEDVPPRGNIPAIEAGAVVFAFDGCDFGLAADDTAIVGEDHRSVTWKPDGTGPFFTIPERAIRRDTGAGSMSAGTRDEGGR